MSYLQNSGMMLVKRLKKWKNIQSSWIFFQIFKFHVFMPPWKDCKAWDKIFDCRKAPAISTTQRILLYFAIFPITFEMKFMTSASWFDYSKFLSSICDQSIVSWWKEGCGSVRRSKKEVVDEIRRDMTNASWNKIRAYRQTFHCSRYSEWLSTVSTIINLRALLSLSISLLSSRLRRF